MAESTETQDKQMSTVPSGSSDRFGKRLESWKEIAAYVNRHVTTVRRWEKQEGLPLQISGIRDYLAIVVWSTTLFSPACFFAQAKTAFLSLSLRTGPRNITKFPTAIIFSLRA